MDYQFWFFMLIAFLLGRGSRLKVYIGSDEEKYNKADFGLLWR